MKRIKGVPISQEKSLHFYQVSQPQNGFHLLYLTLVRARINFILILSQIKMNMSICNWGASLELCDSWGLENRGATKLK